jgi:hypothetical protein
MGGLPCAGQKITASENCSNSAHVDAFDLAPNYLIFTVGDDSPELKNCCRHDNLFSTESATDDEMLPRYRQPVRKLVLQALLWYAYRS